MITNNSLTVYHKELNEITRLEEWKRTNYSAVWIFKGKSASVSKGYEPAKHVEIRIPYRKNLDLNFRNFAIGDIAVVGTLDFDISTQQDLIGYDLFNITSMKDNVFGHNPHVHLTGE